jgi:TPR repeat protein
MEVESAGSYTFEGPTLRTTQIAVSTASFLKMDQGKEYFKKMQFKKAFECYQTILPTEDVQIIGELGYMHYWGYGTKKDSAKGLELLKKASNGGDSGAQRRLGKLYIEEGNVPKGKQLIQQSELQNDPETMLYLADSYRGESEYYEQDFEKSKFYVEKAIELGQPDGYFWLGNWTLEENENKAIAYFRLGAEKGSSLCHFGLGSDYVVKGEQSKAKKSFSKSIELGCGDAAIELGLMYEEQGDLERALKLYLLATDMGVEDGFYQAGKLEVMRENVDAAVRFFSSGLEYDDNNCIFSLGILYVGQEKYVEGKKLLLKSKGMENEDTYHWAMAQIARNGPEKNSSKAIEFLEKAVEKGCEDSAFELATMYKDEKETYVKYLEEAADLGHQEAKKILGGIYMNGELVTRDFKKAIHHLEAIEEKDIQVHGFLALAYKYFGNQEKQFENLRNFIERAQRIHSLDHILKDFLWQIGEMYRFGMGTERAPIKAMECFEGASKLGAIAGNYHIAMMHWDGDLGTVDRQKAIYMLEECVRKKYWKAAVQLGLLYSSPEVFGIEKDVTKAMKYFKMASDAGVDDGKVLFKAMAMIENVGEDALREAVEVCADSNSSWTKYYLAVFMLAMEDQDIDEELGLSASTMIVRVLELSAKENNLEAEYLLGCLYFDGKLVEKNKEISLKHFKNCADRMHTQGLFRMGEMYSVGDSVEKNLARAAEFFVLAARKGHLQATFRLSLLLWNGDGIPQNRNAAVSYFIQVASKGNPNAQFLAGLCYEQGLHVDRSIPTAIEYYSKSAEQGNEEAALSLVKLMLNPNQPIERREPEDYLPTYDEIQAEDAIPMVRIPRGMIPSAALSRQLTMAQQQQLQAAPTTFTVPTMTTTTIPAVTTTFPKAEALKSSKRTESSCSCCTIQ